MLVSPKMLLMIKVCGAINHFLLNIGIEFSFSLKCFHLVIKGLPYMLERAGLDVQQGKTDFWVLSSFLFSFRYCIMMIFRK